jgi:hypothetical protein
MLKKLILTVALTGVAISGFAQGFVNFNTQAVGASAQVYSAPGVLASGTAFFAQLYAADGFNASEGSLTAKGTAVNFRAGGNVGYVQISGTTSAGATVNPTVAVTTVNNGNVTLQLRAWSSSFATYEAAVAGGGAYGSSALLNLASTSAPTGPATLTGLQGFTMVPEPSTYALGLLGAGALLMIRRRK